MVPVEVTMADIVARACQVSQRQKNEQINHDSVSIRLDITEQELEQEQEQWHQQHLYHESCLTGSTARHSSDQSRASRQPKACQPQQPWRQQDQQQPHQQQKRWIHSQMVSNGDHQPRREPV